MPYVENTTDVGLEPKPINLEDAFSDLLGGGMEAESIDGDAQLLEVASKHTLQLDGMQIKALLYIEMFSSLYLTKESEKNALENFKKNYIRYTSHCASQPFIERVLAAISFRRFINENTLKVNIDKNT